MFFVGDAVTDEEENWVGLVGSVKDGMVGLYKPDGTSENVWTHWGSNLKIRDRSFLVGQTVALRDSTGVKGKVMFSEQLLDLTLIEDVENPNIKPDLDKPTLIRNIRTYMPDASAWANSRKHLQKIQCPNELRPGTLVTSGGWFGVVDMPEREYIVQLDVGVQICIAEPEKGDLIVAGESQVYFENNPTFPSLKVRFQNQKLEMVKARVLEKQTCAASREYLEACALSKFGSGSIVAVHTVEADVKWLACLTTRTTRIIPPTTVKATDLTPIYDQTHHLGDVVYIDEQLFPERGSAADFFSSSAVELMYGTEEHVCPFCTKKSSEGRQSYRLGSISQIQSTAVVRWNDGTFSEERGVDLELVDLEDPLHVVEDPFTIGRLFADEGRRRAATPPETDCKPFTLPTVEGRQDKKLTYEENSHWLHRMNVNSICMRERDWLRRRERLGARFPIEEESVDGLMGLEVCGVVPNSFRDTDGKGDENKENSPRNSPRRRRKKKGDLAVLLRKLGLNDEDEEVCEFAILPHKTVAVFLDSMPNYFSVVKKEVCNTCHKVLHILPTRKEDYLQLVQDLNKMILKEIEKRSSDRVVAPIRHFLPEQYMDGIEVALTRPTKCEKADLLQVLSQWGIHMLCLSESGELTFRKITTTEFSVFPSDDSSSEDDESSRDNATSVCSTDDGVGRMNIPDRSRLNSDDDRMTNGPASADEWETIE